MTNRILRFSTTGCHVCHRLCRWPRPSRTSIHPTIHLRQMSDSDIYWTFVTCSKYGGKFYQLLGNAGLAADPINKRLILNTWPMMVATYGTTSRLHREMRFGVAV
jgi:hypothetical protein